MDLLQIIILGIIEGVTEFLPISSTAHLILSSDFLKISQTTFVKSFEISIQLGAILAVVFLYWKKIFLDKEIIKRIIIAFVPTAIIGFLLYNIFKSFLMENTLIIILALLLGGILLIIFEIFYKESPKSIENISKISYSKCVYIGIFQSIAIIPGVSRAAATIIGGLSLGLKRKTIVEFSFLLAVPTMLAATGYDLLKSSPSFSANEFIVLIIGFIISFLVAVLAIKFLLYYIQKNNFILFGIYRIILSFILLIFYIN